MSSSAEEELNIKAAEQAQRAAMVELYLQAFKCAEILAAYPKNPTEGDQLRFSHGLGRELWTVSNAMGMYAAASFASFSGKISVPMLLQVFLQHVEWWGMEIFIDIGKLNRDYVLERYPIQWSFEGTGLLEKEWWKCPQNLFEAMNLPSWMSCKTPSVSVEPRPMSMHQRDIGDASTIPGEIYSLAMNQNAEALHHMELEKQLRKKVMDAMGGNIFILEPDNSSK